MKLTTKLLISFFALYTSTLSSLAQVYPIEINLQIPPPYPTNMDAYFDYLDQGLVQINNTTNSDIDVYFKVRFEESQGLISMEGPSTLTESVTFEPGQVLLSSQDVRDLFAALSESDFSSNGLSDEQWTAIQVNKQLPEGNYKLCVYAFDGLGNRLSDPAGLGCFEFELLYAERPILNIPFDGDTLEATDNVNFIWDHFLTSQDAMARTEYTLKLIDITEQEIKLDNAGNAMVDPRIAADFEENIGNLKSKLIQNDVELPLVKGHTYAARVSASDPLERIFYNFGGHSEMITFTYGKEEEDTTKEEDEGSSTPILSTDAECDDQYVAEIPKNKKPIEEDDISKTVDYQFGKVKLRIKFILGGDTTAGYYGEGFITTKIRDREVAINVVFDSLKINSDKQVFAGKAQGKDDYLGKLDDPTATVLSGLTDLGYDEATLITGLPRLSVKLAAASRGVPISLPFGIDRQVKGDTAVIGITQMVFSPKQASLTALFSMQNETWGEYIPTLGAQGVCFDSDGISKTAKLILAKDYAIPQTSGILELKKYEAVEEGSDSGTYVSLSDGEFEVGQIAAEISIPRTALLPENEEGEIDSTGTAKVYLTGKFWTTRNFILSATISPSQIPGLEGFSFALENGFADYSETENPADIKFPKGYGDTSGVRWTGVWFSNATITAPQGWGLSDDDERSTLSMKNFIKDKSGVSIVGEATNILGIEQGELLGFAISMDTLRLDIIRNQFKQITIDGRMGLPILPADTFLYYHGIVDRPAPTDAAQAIKTQKLNASFTVKTARGGYDIDWLQAHIDFDSTTQIYLVSNDSITGIDCKMSGVIGIKRDQADENGPDLKIPGLRFSGMELSNLSTTNGTSKDKNKSTKGPAASPPLTFKGPTFSLTNKPAAIATSPEDGERKEEVKEEEKKEDDDEDEDEKTEGTKIGNFVLNLDSISFETSTPELKEGTTLTLVLTPSIMLVKPPSDPNDSTDNGYSVTAKTRIALVSEFKVDKKDASKKRIDFKEFKLEEIQLGAEIKGIKLSGKVEFVNDSTETGGVVGEIKVKTDFIEVELAGAFGSKKEFDYWYVYGKVGKINNGKAPATPLYPPAGSPSLLKLWTFGGGAYYHMKNLGDLESPKYTAAADVTLGLKANVTISITEPKTFWAEANLEAEFGDTTRVSFLGKAYMLKDDMKPNTTDKVDGIEASLYTKVNFKESYFSMAATMSIRVNVENGTIVGAQENSSPYTLTTATLSVESPAWHFWMGTPEFPGKANITIPGINLKIVPTAYIMMGTKPMEKAEIPEFITHMIGAVNENFSSNDALSSPATNTRKTFVKEAYALGACIDYSLDLRAAILYARFRAMLGFDLSLEYSENTVCKNYENKPLGIDGWYSEGQVYAGFHGDLGLYVDLFFFSGEISLVELNAAMLLQGGLPNPTWVKGTATMGYKVLGDLITGSTTFAIKSGEACDRDVLFEDPFSGIDFIADMTPGNKTPDTQTKNVSVMANIQVSFNSKVGNGGTTINDPEVFIFESPSNKAIRRFRVKVQSFKLAEKNGKNEVVCFEKWDGFTEVIYSHEDRLLKPQTEYKVSIRLVADEWIMNNGKGEWQSVRTKGIGEWEATETRYFKTGDLSNFIEWENVEYAYPNINESYYLQGQNTKKQGYLQFKASTDYLFKKDEPVDKQWWSKVVAIYTKAGPEYSRIALDTADLVTSTGKLLIFEMPEKLPNGTGITIDFFRIFYENPNYSTKGKELGDLSVEQDSSSVTIQREGKTYTNYPSGAPQNRFLFKYKFATSMFNTIEEKLNSYSKKNLVLNYPYAPDKSLAIMTYEIGGGPEPFSRAEHKYQSVEYDDEDKKDPMLKVQEDYTSAFYVQVKKHQQDVKDAARQYWSHTRTQCVLLDRRYYNLSPYIIDNFNWRNQKGLTAQYLTENWNGFQYSNHYLFGQQSNTFHSTILWNVLKDSKTTYPSVKSKEAGYPGIAKMLKEYNDQNYWEIPTNLLAGQHKLTFIYNAGFEASAPIDIYFTYKPE